MYSDDDDFRWHVGVILLLVFFLSFPLALSDLASFLYLFIQLFSAVVVVLSFSFLKLLYYFHSISLARIEISCFYLRFSLSVALPLMPCHLDFACLLSS
jgi:hypothetical protein